MMLDLSRKRAQWQRSLTGRIGIGILIAVAIAALLGPFFLPFAPDVDLSLRLAAPSKAHLLGCDLYGRDVLRALFAGAYLSLYIAFLSVLLSASLGTLAGLLAGYYKGYWDVILMRLVDILMAFPGILLTLTLTALLGPSRHHIILAIAATGWTSFARIIRAQVLSLREREYILANKALGASSLRTMLYHLLPATLSPLIITATFSLSGVILIEASLSFLGLASQEGPPSWGGLLHQGRSVLLEAPHLSIFPGILIMLVVLAFNFVGDALRDALDPKEH